MSLTHTYLGLHVLSRGIIFVDLALAQVAALGISIAFLLGEEGHGASAHVYVFSATLCVAFLFAKLRNLPNKTAREATIRLCVRRGNGFVYRDSKSFFKGNG